jgi:hypothetical protein
MMENSTAVEKDELAALRLDAARYRWWRENIECIEEDGVAGVAFDWQIPLHGIDTGIPEQTTGQLMDAIADLAIAQAALP